MNREAGQAVMEYAAIVAFMSVTLMLLLLGFGTDLIGIAAEKAGNLAGELG